jgi:hypothetical protein
MVGRVDDAATEDGRAQQLPPRPIVVAAALVFGEAVVLAALSVVELIALDGGRLALGVTNAIFFLLYAAGLVFCARGLFRLSRWSRSPIVMSQLIQIGLAYSFYGNDTVWVAVILAVVAVAILAVLFAPSTTELLYERRFDDEAEPPD